MTPVFQFASVLLAAIMAVNAGGITSVVSVPAATQMAIFQNVWKLDRNFNHNGITTLVVLYQKDHRASLAVKDEIYAAVQAANTNVRFEAVEVGTPELLRQAMADTGADVVYVAPLRAVDVAEIARISRRRRIRTITGVPEYVDAGIAVGIGIRQNRPLIIVNLQGARAEGCDFEAQLLRLARIVGPAS
jgi:hypothetical protein